MSAAEVMDRIKRTAHTPEAGPNMATGYGVVDPLAALTFDLPPADQLPAPLAGRAIAAPPQQVAGSRRARNIVLTGVVACIALAAIALAILKRPSAH
jgi:membrane-anchored mycosin MYCP